MSCSQNVISLLQKIKGFCCKFDSMKQGTRAIVAADKQIYVFFQRNDMTNDDYFEQFNALVDTAASYGSSLGMSRGLVDEELRLMGMDRESCTSTQKSEALATAKEKYLAMLMFNGANKDRFEKMKEDMFEVHTPQGVVKFKPCSRGLHYFDLSEGDALEIMCSQVVPTVRGNFEGYSKHEVLRAIKAQRLQSMVGGPGLADCAGMVREEMI